MKLLPLFSILYYHKQIEDGFMTDNEKRLLGNCIRKYRRSKFTQEELTKGICSKYTLSRLENGIHCKSKIYHELLYKLGYVYHDNFDIVNIQLLFKDIISSILINDITTVFNKIDCVETILNKYKSHIYFTEIKIFLSFLKVHYSNQKIDFSLKDVEVLAYFDKSIRICTIHVLCENMMYFNDYINLKPFLRKFDLRLENHILTDFFLMCDYQYEAQLIKTHAIFKNHSHIFTEENNYFQSIRFHLVYALGYLHKNPDKALVMLDKIKTLKEKSMCTTDYFYIYYFAMIIYCSRKNHWLETYEYALHALENYPSFYAHFLPYIIILSLFLNKEVDARYLVYNNDLLSDACIDLYHMSKTYPHPEKKMLAFINRYLTKYIGKNNSSIPFINVLRKEVIHLVEISFCYRSALVFDALIKKHTNEKEYQL